MGSYTLRRRAVVSALVIAVFAVAMVAVPSAQRQRGGAGADAGAPIATNTILLSPEAYYGKPVTVSAGVEQMLSKTAFVVDQRKAVSASEVKAVGAPLLVIAPYLTGSIEHKHYLLMKGQIVRFDAAAIAKVAADYKLDLAPEVGAKYAGQPVLVATSVIDSTFVELGKKPIPPPRKEDLSMTALMKTINPAFAALRAAAQESKIDLVALQVAALKPAFTQTETLWDDLGASPAAELAREARAHAIAIESAAAAGNWEAAKTSAASLNQVCQSCHGAYRDRQDDGTFRIKPVVF